MNYVGRASFEMGEFRECLTYWDRYMELKPEIVDLPKAHYFRGECLWELGEKEAALASYQGALDTGVETLYTDKARRKLLSYSTESPVASS
jgi:tetratricopeptide (TPR) repeat protein